MLKNKGIHVFSEIGSLKSVLVKRPGRELSCLTPSNYKKWLFSNLVDWKIAAKEHDEFCKILKSNGVEVVYLEDLLDETWKATNDEIHNLFIKKFIEESKVKHIGYNEKIYRYLKSLSSRQVFDAMICGITTKDLKINNLNDVFVAIPMPNLYFTRDVFSSVGNSIVASSMKYFIRKRETIFAWFIFTYHPIYKNTEKLLERDAKSTIEGGDVFPISSETLMIGCSERTQLKSIKSLAQKIVNSANTHFKKIYVVNVPHEPNLMHLDTWLTNVDYTKFIYSPNIHKALKLWYADLTQPEIKFVKKRMSLQEYLDWMIGKKCQMIPVADNYSQVKIDIETNFDATNFLVIRPGVVVGYDRNEYTINALRKAGVKVFPFGGSQLSLGMGSCRCMSMPLERQDIKKIENINQ